MALREKAWLVGASSTDSITTGVLDRDGGYGLANDMKHSFSRLTEVMKGIGGILKGAGQVAVGGLTTALFPIYTLGIYSLARMSPASSQINLGDAYYPLMGALMAVAVVVNVVGVDAMYNFCGRDLMDYGLNDMGEGKSRIRSALRRA